MTGKRKSEESSAAAAGKRKSNSGSAAAAGAAAKKNKTETQWKEGIYHNLKAILYCICMYLWGVAVLELDLATTRSQAHVPCIGRKTHPIAHRS